MSSSPNPWFETEVRESFARMGVMQTIGATLETVGVGVVAIRLPYSDRFTQQNGFMHAGIITTIVDSACGYAALTRSSPGSNVLTVEYKVNFLAPARGDSFLATGQVLKAGRTLTVCQGQVEATSSDGPTTVVVAILATMMILPPR